MLLELFFFVAAPKVPALERAPLFGSDGADGKRIGLMVPVQYNSCNWSRLPLVKKSGGENEFPNKKERGKFPHPSYDFKADTVVV